MNTKTCIWFYGYYVLLIRPQVQQRWIKTSIAKSHTRLWEGENCSSLLLINLLDMILFARIDIARYCYFTFLVQQTFSSKRIPYLICFEFWQPFHIVYVSVHHGIYKYSTAGSQVHSVIFFWLVWCSLLHSRLFEA